MLRFPPSGHQLTSLCRPPHRSCRHALSLHNLKRRKKGPDGRYINPPAHMRKPAITSRWQEPPGPPEMPGDRMMQVIPDRCTQSLVVDVELGRGQGGGC